MYTSIIVLLSSFLITFLVIPGIIHLAIRRNLHTTTKPALDGHKIRNISSLGGVAIFTALRITHSLLIEIPDFPLNYFIASLFIIFLVGLNDDLTGVRPLSRLFAQISVALILVFPGELYLQSVDNILGLTNMGPWFNQLITLLFIVGIINAYNLIDGIDGLAGILGVIASAVLAYIFYANQQIGLAMFFLALLGSLFAFLYFNLLNARIFMGDSGAYIIGICVAMGAIELVNKVSVSHINLGAITITSAYGLITAITIIPVFDTLRVFALRLYSKTHPFKGDNNHIHHRLLKMGLTHTQTSLILGAITILMVACALALQNYSPLKQVLTIFFLALLINLISYLLFQLRSQPQTTPQATNPNQ